MNSKQRRRLRRRGPHLMALLEKTPHFGVLNPTPAQERESTAAMLNHPEFHRLLKHLPAVKRAIQRGARQGTWQNQ